MEKNKSQYLLFLSSSRQGGKQNRSNPIYCGLNLTLLFPGEQLLSIYIHVTRLESFFCVRENSVPNQKEVIFENNKSLLIFTNVFSKKEKKTTCWNLIQCFFPESFNTFPTIILFLLFFLFRIVTFYPCVC